MKRMIAKMLFVAREICRPFGSVPMMVVVRYPLIVLLRFGGNVTLKFLHIIELVLGLSFN